MCFLTSPLIQLTGHSLSTFCTSNTFICDIDILISALHTPAWTFLIYIHELHIHPRNIS